MTQRLVLTIVGTAAAIVAAEHGIATASAQQMTRAVKDGVYSTAQANAGKALYAEQCVSCHGAMTSTTPDMAPLLNDWVFQEKWKTRSVGEFFERIQRTMPQNKEGTLSPQRTAEIVAYILSANQMPAGAGPLPTELDALNEIRLDAVP